MSSNRFLQRFEGKIQVVGKEGVQNVFGGKQENVIVYTNNNFNPNKNRTSNSLNKPKPNPQPPANPKLSNKKIPNEPTPPSQPHQKNPPPPPQPKEKKVENPFLISNPFYLDEEERERAEQERKEREKAEKIERQKEKQREKEAQRQVAEGRKATSVNLNKSLEKKKTEKEWVKLGGLGANIGGEDWVEKKKKLDKMQQFSEQVKSINKDKPKLPKPPGQRKQDKQANTRQKALQYSKNVPKPVVRVLQQQQKEQKQEVVEEKLSELQQYELRHEQLKNMLKNQL